MAEEKGRVLLIGKRGSARTTLANMLVSGEFKDCALQPTDTNSICKTYVGRGWTVIDTMGFGTEPLGGIVPDEYARKMVSDFLEEVKGRYSHIIFVVDGSNIGPDDKLTMPIMWKTLLEIFKGSEENCVVVVTKVRKSTSVWTRPIDEAIPLMFPECKHFLAADFLKFPEVPEATQDEGIVKMRQGELERLEKEMKEIIKDSPWVEPGISKMGDKELEEMATKVTRNLTSSRASELRDWGSRRGSVYEKEIVVRQSGVVYACTPSIPQLLESKFSMVSRVLDGMQNLGKKVKFYRRQCECLLQRSIAASKEIHDVLAGMNWDERRLTPSVFRLIKSLDKLICSMETGRELLRLCGDSDKEQEVALTLSPPGSGTSSFSKFALVLRELDWSLDAFRFLLFHNPEVERATQSEQQSWLPQKFYCLFHNPGVESTSTQSEWQSWLSNFIWCEARGRLVYMGDGENKLVADESCRAADNDRHAQDQQDLISSMESHFSTLQNPSKVQNKRHFHLRALFTKTKKSNKQLSSSEISSYMSLLKNRLQGPGDSSFQGSNTIPSSFWIPGNQEFKSIQLIGAGSYKEVHKCKWLGMNVAVATSQCDQGGPSRTVLEAEAAVLARVQHPNVLSFIGCSYNEEKHQGSLVTELMETSLRSLIDRSNRRRNSYPFTVSESIDILLQIVEAMIHVHACGVMHRDLKADNLLTNRGSNGSGWYVAAVKLIDFGTSKARSAETGSHFKTKNVGTRAWMAPEVIGKEGDEMKLYTMSADVYSFGMTCYEVLTGELPFRSYMGRVLAEMICAGHRPPIPKNCPGDLRELMTKCWAHIPEDRPTFEEIRQNLWNLKLYYSICGI